MSGHESDSFHTSNEGLFELLTPKGTTLSDEAKRYINHLATLPLSSLTSEPGQLQTQSHHLTSSLTSLTHASYPTFISLHNTSTSLNASLETFSSSLKHLIDETLPGLEDCTSNWDKRTKDVFTERKKALLVLEQHDKLRNLFDIPLLIDASVRNGYFDDALRLAAHARAAASSTPGQSHLLASLLSEVNNSISQMLFSLLSTLYESNRKLPALNKAVTFLRRMGAFQSDAEVQSEEQIALAFLTGRETCLKASLEGHKRDIERLVGVPSKDLAERDKEDLVRYLKKYIDAWREGVYDIMTQFATIFSQHQAASTSSTTTAPMLPELRRMIATYASHTLQKHLIPILSSALPRIPLSSLPTFLTQLTYCANAFGRVGLDFRALLPDLFSKAVLAGVSTEVEDATNKLVKTLRDKMGSQESVLSPTLSNGPIRKPLTLPSKFMIVSSAVSTPPRPTLTTTQQRPPPHIPPQILASYPPLAEYTNSLLTTLNSLRLLAPTSLKSPIQSIFDDSLQQISSAFLLFLKRLYDSPNWVRNAAEKTTEEKIATATGEVLFDVLIPFLRRAVGEGVYGVEGEYKVVDDRVVGSDEGESDGTASLTVKVDSSGRLVDVVKEWEDWLQTQRPT